MNFSDLMEYLNKGKVSNDELLKYFNTVVQLNPNYKDWSTDKSKNEFIKYTLKKFLMDSKVECKFLYIGDNRTWQNLNI